MNGDNQLHLGVICRQSVEEANVVWAVCERDLPRTLDRPRTPAGGSGRPPECHAVARREQVQGLLVHSGADFEARGRWSMDGADLKALEVFGKCSTTEKAVVQDPGGGL